MENSLSFLVTFYIFLVSIQRAESWHLKALLYCHPRLAKVSSTSHEVERVGNIKDKNLAAEQPLLCLYTPNKMVIHIKKKKEI